MYTFSEAPSALSTLNHRLSQKVMALLDGITPLCEGKKVPCNSVVECQQGQLLHIRDGVVVEKEEGRTLWVHEVGDLVGIGNAITQPAPTEHFLCSEFAAVVDVYEWQSVLTAVAKSKERFALWNEVLVLDHQRITELLAAHLPSAGPAFPEHLTFEAGEAIVCEGDPADCVYTLVDGEAEVTVEGVTVGMIEADETFGALAALCEMDRTATVLATTDCSVWRWPTEHFNEMVASRPGAVTKLVQDLGRKISNLNQKLVELSEPA